MKQATHTVSAEDFINHTIEHTLASSFGGKVNKKLVVKYTIKVDFLWYEVYNHDRTEYVGTHLHFAVDAYNKI